MRSWRGVPRTARYGTWHVAACLSMSNSPLREPYVTRCAADYCARAFGVRQGTLFRRVLPQQGLSAPSPAVVLCILTGGASGGEDDGSVAHTHDDIHNIRDNDVAST